MKDNKISVYVLDDEPLTLEGIITMIEWMGEDEFDVVGSHLTPELGLKEINRIQPQLLFLDINMPGLSGFELIDKINYTGFKVVFITAFNEFAVRAFKINAVDYLLKPLDTERFKETLQRVKREAKIDIDYKNVLKDIKNKEEQRIGIYTNSGYLLLDFDKIMYIKADNSYSQFHLSDGKVLIHTKNLKHTENLLPEDRFIRISRSVIVQMDSIKEFSFSGGGSITMTDGSEHSIGFTYRKKINSLLKEKYVSK